MMMTLDVRTSERNQLVDITGQIRQAVRESDVSDGTCLIFVPHTTAGVTINENADPTVKRDILMMLTAYCISRDIDPVECMVNKFEKKGFRLEK